MTEEWESRVLVCNAFCKEAEFDPIHNQPLFLPAIKIPRPHLHNLRVQRGKEAPVHGEHSAGICKKRMGKFFHRAKVQPGIVAGEIAGVYHEGILSFQVVVESHVPLLLVQLPHKVQVYLDTFEIPCALVGSAWNAVE